MSFFEYREAEPSFEYLLAQKKEEITQAWGLVQNEAECDFEDADTSKMAKLLKELSRLEEDCANLQSAIERRDTALRGAMCYGSV